MKNIKFLLDENLPIEATRRLKSSGFDAKNAYDLKLIGQDDEKVIKTARKEKRILITLDLDFSNILNYPPGSHPGIIVIRIREPNRKKLTNIIENFVLNMGDNFKNLTEALVILEENGYRIRK